MVGIADHGQLIGAPSARVESNVRFALATPADDAAIRQLLRATPMHGAITLSFEREPDYFRGANLAGGEDQTIVAFEGDRMICMGRCSTRLRWVNGKIHRVAYLAELRLAASAPGRLDVLRGGYRFFHELQRAAPPAFTFTSIAADNHRARRLLERGLPGFPRYEFLSEFVTLLISTHSRAGRSAELETATADEIAKFLNAVGERNLFAAAWSPAQLETNGASDFSSNHFGVIRREGRIVACAALWDQRAFRQTVIRGYSPSLTLLRPLVNALGSLVGLAHLPAVDEILAHAFLSPLAFTPGENGALPELVTAFAQRATSRRLDFLTLGFPVGDASIATLQRRFRCRTYLSCLYRVGWPQDAATPLDAGSVQPEVSLL